MSFRALPQSRLACLGFLPPFIELDMPDCRNPGRSVTSLGARTSYLCAPTEAGLLDFIAVCLDETEDHTQRLLNLEHVG